MKCRVHSVPVEQRGLAVCDNKAGLGPQQLTLMLEHDVKLDNSKIYASRKKYTVLTGCWEMKCWRNKAAVFVTAVFEEKEEYNPNTCGNLLFYFTLQSPSVSFLHNLTASCKPHRDPGRDTQ